jgi:branched-chain amino acid transport system ATP-binding protein
MIGPTDAIAIISCIDILMALALYLPLASGTLFVLPIGAMGLGAYIAAELEIHGQGAALAIAVAALAAGTLSLFAGALVVRMKPWSAAIASLAMVEVIQVIFENFTPTGGATGLLGVPFFTAPVPTYTISAVVVCVLVVLWAGRLGRVLDAIRSDELAAECSGLRVVRIRLGLFFVSGLIAGVAGALSAGYLGFVDPSSYGVAQMNQYLMAAILGGSTTAVGPVLGGAAVSLIPHWLAWAANYTLIIFAVLVLVIIVFRPTGLITRRTLALGTRGVRRLSRSRGSKRGLARRRGRTPRYLANRESFSTLSARGIYKAYGGVEVLRGVDMDLRRGQVLGIIGANGAGKTTLVNVLTGVVPATRGRVEVVTDGHAKTVGKGSPTKAIQIGVARTFQSGRLYSGLTVLEHASLLPGIDASALLELVGLTDRAHDLATSLSYGDQRRVEIARALSSRPEFLFLDEPAAGMSNEEASDVARIIRRVVDTGVGVAVIDHNVEFIRNISDQLLAMHFGAVIASGTPDEVISNPALIEAYLGTPVETAERTGAIDLVPVQAAEPIRRPAMRPAVPLNERLPSPSALQVSDAVVAYGPVTAVRGVSVEVSAGEVRAIIGPNGAGKSSLLRAICGLTPLKSGTVSLCGVDVTRRLVEQRADLGLTLVPEGRGLFGSLTVEENILVGARGGTGSKNTGDIFDLFPALARLRKRKAGLLSGGEQQLVAIARALISKPKVLMIDEPSMGLSPVAVTGVLEVLRDLGDDAPGVLVVEQNARIALSIATMIYVLQQGKVVAAGPSDSTEIEAHAQRAYLGA